MSHEKHDIATPQSWEQLFAGMRAERVPNRLVGLQQRGPGEPAAVYLRRVEQKLTAIYPPALGENGGPVGPPHMGPPGALMWGVLFGDVLVRDLGGRWELPEWTGRIDAKLFDCAVVIPVPAHDPGQKLFPMRRVVTFVNFDREYTLVSMYRFAHDRRAGGVSPDQGPPGQWNWRGGYMFRVIGDDQPDAS